MWLSREQLRRLRPAERAMQSPVPTRVVSNGEYIPLPQTSLQRGVEERLRASSRRVASRLGLSRREFLRTASGMAAAFVAMNQVYGGFFGVDEAEASDLDAARERLDRLADQLVVDVQLHFVRDDYTSKAILALGEYAKRWNPVLEREGVTLQRFQFENFLKEVFLDSDTKIGLVSGAPADDPDNAIVTNDQLARARAVVNAVAGTRRMLCHAMFTPGRPGWIEEMDRAIETLKPDSWKGYTVGDPLAPSRWPWRLDDEKLAYPAYEKMVRSGVRTVCIHKGLLPADYETSWENWRYARVDDVGQAARDWPQLTFVIYHSALKPLMTPPDDLVAQFDASGRIDWVTDLAEIPERFGVDNVYAELGTAFASCAVTHPRLCAAMLGTLIRGLGPERVLWGTDSVWYGSPQWQIEAFRRIEIPDELAEAHGFAKLGAADGPIKRAILGENAARLYGLAPRTAAGPLWRDDGLARMRERYRRDGAAPSNQAYGYIHRERWPGRV